MCHAATGKQFTTVTARRARRFGRDVLRCCRQAIYDQNHLLRSELLVAMCHATIAWHIATSFCAESTRWTYALDLRVVTPSSSSEPLTGCACRKRVTCYAEEVPVGEGLDPPPAYGRRKDGRHGRDV